MPEIALAPCADYSPEHCAQALDAVLAPFGGLDWVRPGMKIGVKVNLVAAMKPETAATTHPALLCELVRRLVARGAQVTVGDSPGGLYNAAFVGRAYSVAGLRAVEDCGASLNRDFSVRELTLPEAKVAKTVTVTGWLLGCDAIINFCKLKSHGMMGMSNAAKNLFGTIPGTVKPEYHFRFPKPEDFADMILDLDEFWKPRLHVCDAVVAMEGNGPTAGTPKPMGLVLAAEDPHRLDLLCAALIGHTREEVPTLAAADRRGLLPASVEELEVNVDWKPYICKDFHFIQERKSLQFEGRSRLVSGFIRKSLEARPKVQPDECVGCGKCASICPAKAIQMKKKLPVIDRKRCIRCFCCQEFCPKGAMKVRRPAIARVLVRTK